MVPSLSVSQAFLRVSFASLLLASAFAHPAQAASCSSSTVTSQGHGPGGPGSANDSRQSTETDCSGTNTNAGAEVANGDVASASEGTQYAMHYQNSTVTASNSSSGPCANAANASCATSQTDRTSHGNGTLQTDEGVFVTALGAPVASVTIERCTLNQTDATSSETRSSSASAPPAANGTSASHSRSTTSQTQSCRQGVYAAGPAGIGLSQDVRRCDTRSDSTNETWVNASQNGSGSSTFKARDSYSSDCSTAVDRAWSLQGTGTPLDGSRVQLFLVYDHRTGYLCNADPSGSSCVPTQDATAAAGFQIALGPADTGAVLTDAPLPEPSLLP
ncbi:MAG: hypothetical protein ACYDDF_14490 [Thermoplasmatota archaeon]